MAALMLADRLGAGAEPTFQRVVVEGEPDRLLMAQQVDDAGMLVSLGKAAQMLGWGKEAARDCFQHSLAIARAIDHKAIAAVALEGLATDAFLDDLDRAGQYYQEGLDVAQVLAVPSQLSGFLADLGKVAHARGHYARAEKYFQPCLALQQKHDYRHLLGSTCTHLATVARDVGERPKAFHYFRRAMERFLEMEQTGLLLWALYQLAPMLLEQGGQESIAAEIVALLRTHPAAARAYREEAEQWLGDRNSEVPVDGDEPSLEGVVDRVLTEVLPKKHLR